MKVRDSRVRYVIRNSTDCRESYILRRLRCMSCGKIHTELPDFILPYKHYDAQAVQDTLDGIPDNTCSADDSTMNRWRASFKSAVETITALLVAYLMQLSGENAPLFALKWILKKIKKDHSNWLAFVMRLLINTGNRLHTKFTFCP